MGRVSRTWAVLGVAASGAAGHARRLWSLCGRGRGGGRGVLLLSDEAAYLLAVVGEDAVAAPDLGASQAVHQAAGPAPAALQGGDAAFGAGPPFDEAAEAGAGLDRAAGGTLASFPYYCHELDANRAEVLVDFGFAVAPVGGDGSGCPPGYGFCPPYSRGEQGPSDGLPTWALWSTTTPSSLSTTWAR